MKIPITIEQAKNGYILSAPVNGEMEKHIVGKFREVLTTIINHFQDQEYIQEELEQANKLNQELEQLETVN